MSPREALTAKRRQEAALRAYIEEGSVKAAAYRLGLTESGVRRRLAAYCAENNTNLPTAIFDFGRQAERARSVTPEREAVHHR